MAHRVGATYTRYADDLTFSGDASLSRGARRLEKMVGDIARDEGFSLNRKKTWVMGRGARQRVTGIVVNQGVSVARDEADAIKATLHNCAKHGPQSQARGVANFRDVLQGKVAWVEFLNPRRGAALRRQLETIDWNS